jgi:hypothetical protein
MLKAVSLFVLLRMTALPFGQFLSRTESNLDTSGWRR